MVRWMKQNASKMDEKIVVAREVIKKKAFLSLKQQKKRTYEKLRHESPCCTSLW